LDGEILNFEFILGEVMINVLIKQRNIIFLFLRKSHSKLLKEFFYKKELKLAWRLKFETLEKFMKKTSWSFFLIEDA